MRRLAAETRYAFRTIVKRPGMSALVVITLGIGLGANAAIFAMIDALLLNPFTIPQLDRLVMIAETSPGAAGNARETASPANFLDWKKQADGFERLAAFEWWDVNLAGGSEPERVSGFFVSADFFPALGVAPVLGRAFSADEETQGRHRRVVLSHGLWQRRFAADPAILGKAILLDAVPYEVVGIAPGGFGFPMGAELWAPLSFDAATAARRQSRYLSVIGRLAPGRSLDDAGAQMAVIAQRLEQQYPEVNRGHGARVSTLVQGMRDEGLGPILGLCQASAFFVLLIACANVANLLLAQGAERQRELAVRLAIGASRGRLVREMLIEGGLLSLAAVPAALAAAWLAIRLIRVNMPPRLVRFVTGWERMDIDGSLVIFTSLLAFAAVLVFAVLPALQASRPRLAEALKEGGRSQSAGRNRQRVRRTLVVVEMALALPLLVASGLGVIAAQRFLNGPQGYEPDHVQTMRAVLPNARYAEPAARRRFTTAVVDGLRQLPGVESAAAVNVIPAAGNNAGTAIQFEGRPATDPAHRPAVDYRAATPSFFDTMRIPIVRGRGFTPADRENGLEVAIVSEALASQYFPGADPIGQRIRLGPGSGLWITIVGVSGDVIHGWFDRRRYPTVYRPYAQAPTGSVVFAIRTAGDPDALALAAGGVVRSVDPTQPVFDVMTMRAMLYERTIGLQYVAVIMAVFGGLALVLAVVGVYSMMAFVIAQRTHEIGVRIALGATRHDVVRLAVGQALTLTAGGAALGLVLATALGRLMEAGLLGVVSSDARLSLGFAAILVAAALAAGYIPARRASGINPIIALRNQ